MRLPATGCRSPALLGLVLLLTVGACCVFGVTSGALISELRLAQFLDQRGEGQATTAGAATPRGRMAQVAWLTASPTSAPATTPPGSGQPQTQPPDTPAIPTPSPTGVPVQAAAPPAASAPTTARPPVEQSLSSPPRKGLPANQPTHPATRLVIPSLEVDAPVVLLTLDALLGTWDISQLTQAVGHLQGTATPGDPSNVALAGHVTLTQGRDGPFRNLAQLKMGDDVLVYSGDQVYRYAVESVRVVTPEDVEVTFPTTQPTLTLITCANWDTARRVYDQRVVAVGRLVP